MTTVLQIRRAIADRFNASIGRSYVMDYGWSLGYIDACIRIGGLDGLTQGDVKELRAFVEILYDPGLLDEIRQAEMKIVDKFNGE